MARTGGWWVQFSLPTPAGSVYCKKVSYPRCSGLTSFPVFALTLAIALALPKIAWHFKNRERGLAPFSGNIAACRKAVFPEQIYAKSPKNGKFA